MDSPILVGYAQAHLARRDDDLDAAASRSPTESSTADPAAAATGAMAAAPAPDADRQATDTKVPSTGGNQISHMSLVPASSSPDSAHADASARNGISEASKIKTGIGSLTSPPTTDLTAILAGLLGGTVALCVLGAVISFVVLRRRNRSKRQMAKAMRTPEPYQIGKNGLLATSAGDIHFDGGAFDPQPSASAASSRGPGDQAKPLDGAWGVLQKPQPLFRAYEYQGPIHAADSVPPSYIQPLHDVAAGMTGAAPVHYVPAQNAHGGGGGAHGDYDPTMATQPAYAARGYVHSEGGHGMPHQQHQQQQQQYMQQHQQQHAMGTMSVANGPSYATAGSVPGPATTMTMTMVPPPPSAAPAMMAAPAAASASANVYAGSIGTTRGPLVPSDSVKSMSAPIDTATRQASEVQGAHGPEPSARVEAAIVVMAAAATGPTTASTVLSTDRQNTMGSTMTPVKAAAKPMSPTAASTMVLTSPPASSDDVPVSPRVVGKWPRRTLSCAYDPKTAALVLAQAGIDPDAADAVEDAAAAAAAAAGEADGEAAPIPYMVVAMGPFTHSLDDEIDLLENDMLNVERDFSDGWALGHNQRSGATGYFPLTFCQVVPAAS
ncbi:hypothetical protein CXG81DRAFT_27387 [Caulochytrium protostelioides]|uniref:SH3 domain-containing protein n=1 Tax=Caulochytrium protostelioides TaxID=1555241 RepID=A0A4P9X494_9FUNG|nr:hypothetical protein CXG81DRAFT_27387 [Caulochytrium protostelioides]|eukprot:RKO99879.1 hypothetical protein CXG81DRAFT_27387 [Caulochytrium protostelioides]